MDTIKDLKVEPYENYRKVMYMTKEILVNVEKMKLVALSAGTNVAVRAAETLCRLGYVTYEDIQTETIVENERLRTKTTITLKKTPNFNKIYQENEENRKKKEQEKK